VNRSGVRPSPIFLVILGVAVLGGVLATLGSAELGGSSSVMLDAGVFLLVIGGWAATLCLHEFGHAYVAYRGGDYGVRAKGYLNLDIRRYTDPVFSLVLPLVLLAFGGIPLPGGAVWINHSALRSRRVESLVSLAGPAANLLIGVLLTLAVGYIPGIPIGLAIGLSYLALLQILAFILNILPIPGLDGWGAIEPWLSYEAKRFGAMVRPWAPLVLFALLIGVRAINTLFFTITDDVFGAIGGDQSLASLGPYYFQFWLH
jgi:Zn-dependent protease